MRNRAGLSLWMTLGIALVSSDWGHATSQEAKAGSDYYLYVCAESEDEVALVRFGRDRAAVEKVIPVGHFPTDIEGPHGINISPDGRYWYVSLAHGNPFGTVHKYETGSDLWVGYATLGMYPATLDIAASTGLLYIVNFNLHGDMTPSSISVVDTETMSEVKRITTGVMPHGARLNATGDRLYSVNMMDDELVEIDALAFKVARRLCLVPWAPNSGDTRPSQAALVQPTWVSPPTRTRHVYVTGNKSNQVFEVDLGTWTVSRVLSNTGKGPYNLAVTPDGESLVVTYKKGSAVGFWDIASAKEMARVSTLRRLPHGVVISPDGSYCFVSVEGVGGEPGTVEMYSLASKERLAVVQIGKQAGGIVFWKMETDESCASRLMTH